MKPIHQILRMSGAEVQIVPLSLWQDCLGGLLAVFSSNGCGGPIPTWKRPFEEVSQFDRQNRSAAAERINVLLSGFGKLRPKAPWIFHLLTLVRRIDRWADYAVFSQLCQRLLPDGQQLPLISRQIGLCCGRVIAMLAASKIDYHFWRRFAIP